MKKNINQLKLSNSTDKDGKLTGGFMSIRGGISIIKDIPLPNTSGHCTNPGCTNATGCQSDNGGCTNKTYCDGLNQYTCTNSQLCL